MSKKNRTKAPAVAPPRKSSGFGAMSGTAVLEQAPEVETDIEQSDSPVYNLPHIYAAAAPPPVQRSATMLDKAPNTNVRQQIMRTLQTQYGNSYARAVAGHLSALQRLPLAPAPAPAKPVAGQPEAGTPMVQVPPMFFEASGNSSLMTRAADPNVANAINRIAGIQRQQVQTAQAPYKETGIFDHLWDQLPDYFNQHRSNDPAIASKAQGKPFGTAAVPAYGKPITAGATPLPSPQTNLGFGGSNSGTLAPTNGTVSSSADEGYSANGQDMYVGTRSNANGAWEQNSPKANERGNGTRETNIGDRTEGNYNVAYNGSETTGNWRRNSTTSTDLLGVKTETTNNQIGVGTQSHLTETYTQQGSPRTITGSQTSNTGAWVTNEGKTATYGDLSAEKNRDDRRSERTDTRSSGNGERNQRSHTDETKETWTQNGVTTTNTATTKNTRDSIDGSWNNRETKVTQFGDANKDNKVRESATKATSGEGVRTNLENSVEDKTERDGFTRSDKNTTRQTNTQGSWQDVDEKETVYTNRRESSSTTTFGTGTRQQTERTREVKNTFSGENEVPVTYGNRETTKNSSIDGTWGERSTKDRQQDLTIGGRRVGNFNESTVTSKDGRGTRVETGKETATDYVDDEGRERSNSTTLNTRTTKGVETSVTTTTTTGNGGYNQTTRGTYFRGTQKNTDYSETRNKPKDESAPPANPRMQEAVLWNHDFGGTDGAKENAKAAGTYSTTGTKGQDGFREGYTYNGGYTQTSSKATVTTGSATYAGSATAGYALAGGQYNRTDATQLGAVKVRNDFSAGGMVGATATAGGGATISWNGDPSITARGNASVFVGAKGNVSNTTTASLGKAALTGTVTGEAQAGAGADARGELGISTKGLMAQGEASAFAGLKGTVNGQITGGYGGHNFLTLKGGLEGSVGAGASAKGTFNIDWTTGTVTIGGGLSATLGLGAGASGEVTVNFVEMALAGGEAINDGVEAFVNSPYKQKVVDALIGARDRVKQAGADVWQSIMSVPGKLDNIRKDLGKRFDDFTKTLPTWNSIVTGAKSRFDGFMNGLNNFGNSLTSQLFGQSQQTGSFSGMGLAMINPLGMTNGAISQLASLGAAKFPQVVASVTQFGAARVQELQNLGSNIMAKGESLVNNVKAMGESFRQNLSNGVSQVMQIGSTAYSAIGNLANGAKAFGQNVAASFTQGWNSFKSFGTGAISMAGQKLSEIGSMGRAALGNIGGMVSGLVGKGQGLMSMASSKLSSLSSAGQSVVSWAMDKVSGLKAKMSGLPDLLRKPIESLLDLATGKLDTAKSVTSSVMSAAPEMVSSASAKTSAAVQVGEQAKSQISSTASAASSVVQAGANAVKSKVSSANSAMASASAGLKERVSSANEKSASAKETVNAKSKEAASTAKSASSTLQGNVQTAVGAVQGVWNGVEGKAQQHMGAAQNVLTTSENTAKAAAQIATTGWAGAKSVATSLLADAKATAQQAASIATQSAGEITQKGAEVKAGVSAGIGVATGAFAQANATAQSAWSVVPESIASGKSIVADGIAGIRSKVEQTGQATMEEARGLTQRADQIVESKAREVEAAVRGSMSVGGVHRTPVNRAAKGSTPDFSGIISSAISSGQNALEGIAGQITSVKGKATAEADGHIATSEQVAEPALGKTAGDTQGALSKSGDAVQSFGETASAQDAQTKAKGEAASSAAQGKFEAAKEANQNVQQVATANNAAATAQKETSAAAAADQMAKINSAKQEAQSKLQSSKSELQATQASAQQTSTQNQATMQQAHTSANSQVVAQKAAVAAEKATAQATITQEKATVQQEQAKAQTEAQQQRSEVEQQKAQAQSQAEGEKGKLQSETASANSTVQQQGQELEAEQGNINSKASGYESQINSARG
jgi:hypothetical protein